MIEDRVSEMTQPKEVFRLIVVETAFNRGLSLSASEIELVVDAILCSDGYSINVDLNAPCGFGETEAELVKEFDAFVSALMESVPDVEENLGGSISEMVENVIKNIATTVAASISEQVLQHDFELKDAEGYRAEMVQRLWGRPIRKLGVLRGLVVEWGGMASKLRQGFYAQPNTAFALDRLVSRACKIVGEIILLIRSGYADGALARWRSLHEVCVIAMFISRRSDRCAEMYLAHHCIEELKLLRVDKESGTAQNSSFWGDHYFRDLQNRRTLLINRYGRGYDGDNGWAAVELGRVKVSFKDLERCVGLETLRRGYQRANSTVHGGALATLTRVSLNTVTVDDTNISPAYGCEMATKYATASLSLLVAELCLDINNADLVTLGMVIANLASEIYDEISDTESVIAGDTPRERMLERRAAQRQVRSKPRPRFRR